LVRVGCERSRKFINAEMWHMYAALHVPVSLLHFGVLMMALECGIGIDEKDTTFRLPSATSHENSL